MLITLKKILVKRMLEFDTLKAEYIDGIYNISEQNIPNGWSKNAFLAELNKPNVIYSIALIDGGVAGFLGVQYVLDTAEITNIAVSDNYKRQGIATKLLNNVFKQLKSQNISSIELEVRETNFSAQMLYQKADFIKCGVRKRYYSDTGESAILMTKQI